MSLKSDMIALYFINLLYADVQLGYKDPCPVRRRHNSCVTSIRAPYADVSTVVLRVCVPPTRTSQQLSCEHVSIKKVLRQGQLTSKRGNQDHVINLHLSCRYCKKGTKICILISNYESCDFSSVISFGVPTCFGT